MLVGIGKSASWSAQKHWQETRSQERTTGFLLQTSQLPKGKPQEKSLRAPPLSQSLLSAAGKGLSGGTIKVKFREEYRNPLEYTGPAGIALLCVISKGIFNHSD